MNTEARWRYLWCADLSESHKTSGYKLPNCLYKTGNTGVWVCRRAQAALLSPSRMCCYGCMGRLLQNFPPLNMLQVWTTLGKGYRQTKSNIPLEVPVRSQVWRTTEQSGRVRIQLERRWWKVRKPSSGLRNHVPPLGCSVASHGCQRVIVSSGGCGDWGHDEVCHTLRGEITSPFLSWSLCLPVICHRERLVMMLVLHKDWVQEHQAQGRKPRSSAFRFKHTFGQERT